MRVCVCLQKGVFWCFFVFMYLCRSASVSVPVCVSMSLSLLLSLCVWEGGCVTVCMYECVCDCV